MILMMMIIIILIIRYHHILNIIISQCLRFRKGALNIYLYS